MQTNAEGLRKGLPVATSDEALTRFKVADQAFERKLTLDTGHANIGNPGGRRILEFIEKFGHRIGHLHVSDNFGERDDHIPLGAGNIDFVKIVNELKQCGYDDTATLEIFSEDRRELKNSREIFDDILNKS